MVVNDKHLPREIKIFLTAFDYQNIRRIKENDELKRWKNETPKYGMETPN